MPDTPERTDLERQIETLISKASDLLRRQRDDVRRNATGAHDREQDALTEAS
jgi:hypothetical protein